MAKCNKTGELVYRIEFTGHKREGFGEKSPWAIDDWK